MFAILFEALLREIQEEIHHFAGWEGGGGKGHENCEQTFCEQTGASYENLHPHEGNPLKLRLKQAPTRFSILSLQVSCDLWKVTLDSGF